MTRRSIVAVAAIVLAGASCGGGNSGISGSASKALQSDLDVAKAAVASRNLVVARGALSRLSQETLLFAADHQVDSSAAARILASVGAVEKQLSLAAPPTSTTATAPAASTSSTTAAPTTAPSRPRDHGGAGKKGHGGGG